MLPKKGKSIGRERPKHKPTGPKVKRKPKVTSKTKPKPKVKPKAKSKPRPKPKPEAKPKLETEGSELVLTTPENAQRSLKIIVDAFTGNAPVDVNAAKRAIATTLSDYDKKAKTMLMATAMTKFGRVEKLIRMLDDLEGRLFNPAVIAGASTFELLQMYKAAQTVNTEALVFIERTLKIKEAVDDGKLSFEPTDDEAEIDMSDVALMSPAIRERVRRLLDVLFQSDVVVIHDEDDDTTNNN